MRPTRLKHDSNSRLTEPGPRGNSVLLKRLWKNRDGGVAPMLALAAIPIMGFVGAAIDFSRAASVRTAMQTALDATALMLSKEAQGCRRPTSSRRPTTISRRTFTRPEAHNVQVTQPAERAAGGQLHPQDDRQRQHRSGVHQAARADPARLLRLRRGAVGHQEAQHRAGARQHRLDGVERQDDEPQDRRAQPAHHAAERGEAARRRAGLDRAVRGRRQRRHRATSTRPGSTGPTGRPPTAPAAAAATRKKSTCESNGKIWTPAAAQPVERLRQRPRPEQRRQQHRAGRRQPGDHVPRPSGRQLPDLR